MKHPTVATLYKETSQKLRNAGISEWQSEAYLILQHCLGCSRAKLFLIWDNEVDSKAYSCWQKSLTRRCSGEPFHYIAGIREFWSMDFLVTPDVLIPRPETELLVEHALKFIQDKNDTIGTLLDMCTGSGAIGIVLAQETGKDVIAVDISSQSLVVAKKNRARHKVEGHVHLLCSDLFAAFLPQEQFICITANPPYIAEDEFLTLQSEVRDFEPSMALSDGANGLTIIGRILNQAADYLLPEGKLFMEIGSGQKEAVLRMAHQAGWHNSKVFNDLAGRPRIFCAEKEYH